MAREAEDAGWDGFFIWDPLQFMPAPLDVIRRMWRHVALRSDHMHSQGVGPPG